MVPSSTTVHISLATRLPMQAGEGGSAFAVEVGLQAVANGFVQQDAGPAGAEHHLHLAGRASRALSCMTAWRAASFGQVLPG